MVSDGFAPLALLAALLALAIAPAQAQVPPQRSRCW
jgi:hypothetical protein